MNLEDFKAYVKTRKLLDTEFMPTENVIFHKTTIIPAS